MAEQIGNNQAPEIGAKEKWLFWACFIALIATAFGFIVRTQVIDDWGAQFGLSETQKGEIFGVGLWPFALSIILFSLVIDRIGYGKAMVFAFICHVSSAVLTIYAKGYWSLYIATFIVALGNGTVEAVINPVVATLFSREKTKWLNILHAGWPGGLVLGGILAIFMGENFSWEWKVGLLLIPTVIYGLMMLGRHFPVSERVQAGVSYKAMLREVGAIGVLIVSALIVREAFTRLGAAFHQLELPALESVVTNGWVQVGVVAVLVIGYGLYVRSLGRPMFIFLLLIMAPLATTELGTDSWITDLMKPEMVDLGVNAGWVLVYTSTIMMILRFFAGPIVHRLSPLGLLAVSSLVAALGLVFLSKSTGVMILVAATVYGFGKTFFWPTMLGVVAERFPRGGALTLNATGGMGMLSVGVIGAALLGNIQDKEIDRKLEENHPQIHAQVVDEPKLSVFGEYRPIDQTKLEAASAGAKETVAEIQGAAKKSALMTVAVFPVIMLVCYLILVLYFRTKGGYKAEVLTGHAAEDEEYTGGREGPVEA